MSITGMQILVTLFIPISNHSFPPTYHGAQLSFPPPLPQCALMIPPLLPLSLPGCEELHHPQLLGLKDQLVKAVRSELDRGTLAAVTLPRGTGSAARGGCANLPAQASVGQGLELRYIGVGVAW